MFFFQQLGSEDQVRFILDRQRKRIIALDLSGTVEILSPLKLLSFLEQCNAEVISAETFEAFPILEVSQNARGLGKAAVGHEDLRAQESQIVANLWRNSTADTLHGIQGIDRLVFLKVDPCQAENGLIAHRLLDVALDDRRDGAPGTLVHPIGQFEITHGKLGVVDMVI